MVFVVILVLSIKFGLCRVFRRERGFGFSVFGNMKLEIRFIVLDCNIF